MPFWKVRANATVAHAGRAQKPGTVLALPRRIAEEFPHALDECTADGMVLTVPTPNWTKALETIPPHENVDVLKAEREQLVAQIAELRRQEEEAIVEATSMSQALVDAETSLARLDDRIEDEIAAARQLLEQRLVAEAVASPSTVDESATQ